MLFPSFSRTEYLKLYMFIDIYIHACGWVQNSLAYKLQRSGSYLYCLVKFIGIV